MCTLSLFCKVLVHLVEICFDDPEMVIFLDKLNAPTT